MIGSRRKRLLPVWYVEMAKTGRRHVVFTRCRIAEISVPAWLMPIQKTKFVMENRRGGGEAPGWFLSKPPRLLHNNYAPTSPCGSPDRCTASSPAFRRRAPEAHTSRPASVH